MKRTYDQGARFYDAISGERLVYRRGRVTGIKLLGLQKGDTVLDVGCGTGLNFALLVEAVGASGRVIGLDRSAAMLAMAHQRITANAWSNVSAVQADARDFSALALGVHGESNPAGGRTGIVDMQLPTGSAALLSPLARLACWMGGSDIHAHPWTALRGSGRDRVEVTVRGGHIVAAAATIP
jgi:SAM-dependent methyltransferase